MSKRSRGEDCPTVDIGDLAATVDRWVSGAAGTTTTEVEARLGRLDPDWTPLWPAGTVSPGDLRREGDGPATGTRQIDYTMGDGARVTWDVDQRRIQAVVCKTRLSTCQVDLGGGVAAKVVLSEERPLKATPKTKAELAAEAVFVRMKTRKSWHPAGSGGWRTDVTAVKEGPTPQRMQQGVSVEIEWTPGGTGCGLAKELRSVASALQRRLA